MERKLPVLLPAPAPRGEELPPQKKSDSRKRSGVSVACNSCRAKRVKCDGQRPQCSQCQLKELECIYTAQENETPAGALKRENHVLKQKTADVQELFSLLRAMPEDQSFAVIRHIRSCHSEPGDVVRQIKQGDFNSDSALSTITTASAYLPQLLSSLELELFTTHPNAYPQLGPLDVGTVDLNLIGIPFRFRSKPNPGRHNDEFHQALSERQVPVHRFRSTSPSVSGQGGATPTTSGPKFAPTANLCDPRLNSVNAKYWTNISVSNATVAGAISQYLQHEHPLSGFFDADLFIRDLAEPSTTFCSQLLFHSLMAYACQGYSFYDKSAAPLADEFYDEAVRQWHAESDRDYVTTFSASLVLFLASGSMGRDEEGVVFYKESVAIGTRLGLFGGLGDEQSFTSRSKGPAHTTDMERFRSVAAWGLFNWHTLHSFYDRQEPSILTAPSTAFPQNQENAPYMGETFPKLSQLCTIVNGIASQCFSSGITDGVTMQRAETQFHKLMSWSDNLPAFLVRDLGITHHAIVVHIWFHTVVIETFRPFSSDPKSRPSLISAASLKQLKRLIYVFRSKFVASKCTFIYQPGLLYLVNCLLSNVENNEAHFYFLLCIGGYLDLAARYPVIGSIARSIFQMAVEKGVILPADAARALEEIDAKSKKMGADMMDTNPTMDGPAGLAPEQRQSAPIGMPWEEGLALETASDFWSGDPNLLDFSFADGSDMFSKD